ncbi:MAG: hypothetical protein ACREPM_17380 [Gemmatimonadaceae bacterium]
MSHREFRDETGRAWEVWDVRPSISAAPTQSGVEGGNLAALELQIRRHARFHLPAEFENGWLAFQSNGESRRLAPIPQSWISLGDRDLAVLVRSAQPIAKPIAKPIARLTAK